MVKNNNVVENAVNTENNKFSKFVIPLIIVVAVIMVSIAVIVVVSNKKESPNLASGTNTASGSNSSSSINSSSNESYSASELEKNVITSGSITKNGKLVVFVTNNNKVAVDMKIEVEFYDSNNTIVGSGGESLKAVGSGAEIAVEMWSTPDSWDNYKIYVDLEQTNEYSYFDKISINHSQTKDNIAVQVTNNSDATIEYITVAVVYYQGEEVVGIDDSIASDIKPGRSGNFNLYFPHDKNYKDVRFDNYKVFVTEAYSYNW